MNINTRVGPELFGAIPIVGIVIYIYMYILLDLYIERDNI